MLLLTNLITLTAHAHRTLDSFVPGVTKVVVVVVVVVANIIQSPFDKHVVLGLLTFYRPEQISLIRNLSPLT